MGELGAFLKIERKDYTERAPQERVHDYHEFVRTLSGEELARRSSLRSPWL